VGKEIDIAQCAFKCCNATIVDVSRLRVKKQKQAGKKNELQFDILTASPVFLNIL
jgi:peroxiredoxin